MKQVQDLLRFMQKYGATNHILLGGGEFLEQEISTFYSKLRPVDLSDNSLNLIRIGNQSGDGGYLIPNEMLNSLDACVSVGIGNEYNFEKWLLESGKQVIAVDRIIPYDPVLESAICVRKNLTPQAYSESETNLDEVLNSFTKEGANLMLKLDIEGDEYRVFNSMSNYQLESFSIIVCEFHSLSALLHPFTRNKILCPALERLCEYFIPVHVHSNNSVPNWRFGARVYPEALEVTWIHKLDANRDLFFAELPHTYDVPTNPALEEFPLQDFFENV